MTRKDVSYPVVLPMLYGVKRATKAPPNTVDDDDNNKNNDETDDEAEFDILYLHGAMNNNMLRTIERSNAQVCVNVTLLDALVLAKSTFHSTCNYRSVWFV
jgi:nitroimidazol reductase NimA-like FMN-containing flavoprotein (pyridoxamine 5'-phosphate oxidase superfamily)